MSTDVQKTVVPPEEDAHFEAVWELKEAIRDRDGVLRQRKRFFSRAYRQSRVYLLRTAGDGVVGFGVVRSDGYLLFLGVSPDHRERGFGRRIISMASRDHDRITCHVRQSNEGAIGFYRRLGFDVERRIDSYYADGEGALFLALES